MLMLQLDTVHKYFVISALFETPANFSAPRTITSQNCLGNKTEHVRFVFVCAYPNEISLMLKNVDFVGFFDIRIIIAEK